jgi:hypothetical protein
VLTCAQRQIAQSFKLEEVNEAMAACRNVRIVPTATATTTT